MKYKEFTIEYDYIDANRVYRVESDHSVHRFPNLYYALQFCKNVWMQLNPQKIYFIRCEVNDHGWVNGFHYFVKLEDAIKLMRQYVARQIWHARDERKKVFLKVFGDSVMDDVSRNPQRSQTIFVRIDKDTFEYRVWSADLRYSELPKDMCFNY